MFGCHWVTSLGASLVPSDGSFGEWRGSLCGRVAGEAQAARVPLMSVLRGRQRLLLLLVRMGVQDSHLSSAGSLERLRHFVVTRHLLIRLGAWHETLMEQDVFYQKGFYLASLHLPDFLPKENRLFLDAVVCAPWHFQGIGFSASGLRCMRQKGDAGN